MLDAGGWVPADPTPGRLFTPSISRYGGATGVAGASTVTVHPRDSSPVRDVSPAADGAVLNSSDRVPPDVAHPLTVASTASTAAWSSWL